METGKIKKNKKIYKTNKNNEWIKNTLDLAADSRTLATNGTT